MLLHEHMSVAYMCVREVRLDLQRLAGGVYCLRELALLALLLAFARLLGRTDDIVEALGDRLPDGRCGAGIAGGQREERRHARTADVPHARSEERRVGKEGRARRGR